jgi:hypothetical protein
VSWEAFAGGVMNAQEIPDQKIQRFPEIRRKS